MLNYVRLYGFAYTYELAMRDQKTLKKRTYNQLLQKEYIFGEELAVPMKIERVIHIGAFSREILKIFLASGAPSDNCLLTYYIK